MPTPRKRPAGPAKPNFDKKDKSFFSNKTQRTSPKKAKSEKAGSDGLRLNRYISLAGICSRREADVYIQSGNVKVNGVVIHEMGYQVKPGDQVHFDGQLLQPEKPVYILMNKPKNFSTSGALNSPKHVMRLLDLPKNSTARPMGRMDGQTTGLLLISNDNALHQRFADAKGRAKKMYHITLDKILQTDDFHKIKNGLHIDGHGLKVDEISYVDQAPRTEVGVVVQFSSISILRKLFAHLGYQALQIDRVVLADLTKKKLPRGEWRYLTPQEVINLKNVL